MNNFVLNMFTRFKQNTNSFKLYIFNNKNYMSLEANTGEKKEMGVGAQRKIHFVKLSR